MCLYIRAKNSNPVDLSIDLAVHNKITKISVELDKYASFFDGCIDFKFLSEILDRFKNNTCLSVSFTPVDLIDYRALSLLRLLFSRTQYLTEIEISFERCQIANEPITSFCTEILPQAISLKSLTLKLGSTLVSDTSLFALAKSLSPLGPLSKNLESFTLGMRSTVITDNETEKIFHSILGVKILDLDLKGTLVTDKSLKVLGNHIMPCMKNLEKFVLNCSNTKITMEGVSAVLKRIPNGIRCLNLDFSGVVLPDVVIFLFEKSVCPKLESVEDVHVKLEGRDLAFKISKILEIVREDAAKRMRAC